MKTGFHINTASLDDLKNHFEGLSTSYVAKISQPMNDYLTKIANNATLYEYWEKDVLIGLAAVYTNRGVENPAYLTNISVIQNQQAKGIGSKILNLIMSDLQKKGFEILVLEVKKNNKTASNLYRRKGFIIMKKQGADSCLMSLCLQNNNTIPPHTPIHSSADSQ